MGNAGAIVNTQRLSEKLQERMAELKFKLDEKDSPPLTLELYRERPDLRQAPSQRINGLYALRWRQLRNTKQQRPTELVHVIHRLELQIGRRQSGKDYQGDQLVIAARAEQIVSWIIARGLGGFTPEWEDTNYEMLETSSVHLATIVLTCTGFWEHSRQLAG